MQVRSGRSDAWSVTAARPGRGCVAVLAAALLIVLAAGPGRAQQTEVLDGAVTDRVGALDDDARVR